MLLYRPISGPIGFNIAVAKQLRVLLTFMRFSLCGVLCGLMLMTRGVL